MSRFRYRQRFNCAFLTFVHCVRSAHVHPSTSVASARFCPNITVITYVFDLSKGAKRTTVGKNGSMYCKTTMALLSLEDCEPSVSSP